MYFFQMRGGKGMSSRRIQSGKAMDWKTVMCYDMCMCCDMDMCFGMCMCRIMKDQTPFASDGHIDFDLS